MDKNEKDASSQNILKMDKANRSITVFKPNTNLTTELPKTYYFDNVFGDDSTQVRLVFFSICFVIDFRKSSMSLFKLSIS